MQVLYSCPDCGEQLTLEHQELPTKHACIFKVESWYQCGKCKKRFELEEITGPPPELYIKEYPLTKIETNIMNESLTFTGAARDWDSLAKAKDLDQLIKHTGDWRREKGFETGWGNFPEKLMLIITELAETTEAFKEEYSKLLNSKMITLDEDNFAEEWIDVGVRVIDLIDACGLEVTGSVKDTMVKHSVAEYCCEMGIQYPTSIENADTCWESTLFLATAMEKFRDVDINKIDPDSAAIKIISKCLSSILYESFCVVERLQRDWWEEYADKMEKNEKRVSKHGRKR